MKLYIAVLDEFPDYMTPTLVAHAMLGAHLQFSEFDAAAFSVGVVEHKYPTYIDWIDNSFKKCVVRVNQREFDRIAALPDVYLAHENRTLEGRKACAVVCPRLDVPNVLKFARLWAPKNQSIN